MVAKLVRGRRTRLRLDGRSTPAADLQARLDAALKQIERKPVMGAYAYCDTPGCDMPLVRPTLNDIAHDDWTCSARHHNALRQSPIVLLCEIVEAQVERIEALEQKVGSLSSENVDSLIDLLS